MKSSLPEMGDFIGDLPRSDPSHGVRPMLLALIGAAAEGIGLMLIAPIIAVLGQGHLGGGEAPGCRTR